MNLREKIFGVKPNLKFEDQDLSERERKIFVYGLFYGAVTVFIILTAAFIMIL